MVPRIMVVDDEEGVVTVVGEALRKEGYEVLEAYDGSECLEKIKSDKPDLVLLDVMMPGLDGLEVCREIKQNPETKNIKVAVFTVRTSQRDRELSAEYLADYHIDKPISMDMLIKTVGRLLKD
jgi:CheY-like chemotaxis protein